MVFRLHFLTDENTYMDYAGRPVSGGGWSCHHIRPDGILPADSGADVFLSDSDEGIKRAIQTGRPVIGISRPGNEGESLMACPWLITSPEAIDREFLDMIWHRHYRLPLKILETGRFIVRELSSGDLRPLLMLQEENAGNPDGCFFPADCPDPEAYLDHYIDCQYPFYGWGIYAIVNKEKASTIGIAGFSTPGTQEDEAGSGSLETAYSLLKDYQNQGILSEILPLLLSYAGRHYPDREVVCISRPDHTASIRLAEKNGIRIIISDPD